jgi:hypothetical protein
MVCRWFVDFFYYSWLVGRFRLVDFNILFIFLLTSDFDRE